MSFVESQHLNLSHSETQIEPFEVALSLFQVSDIKTILPELPATLKALVTHF